jgi:hypothetical protein
VPLVGESRDGLLAEAGACEANRNLPALMLRTHTSTPMELRKAFQGAAGRMIQRGGAASRTQQLAREPHRGG